MRASRKIANPSLEFGGCGAHHPTLSVATPEDGKGLSTSPESSLTFAEDARRRAASSLGVTARMKHCPNQDCDHLARHGRASEFLDAVQVCSDCGAPLEAGEAPPPPQLEYQELATVYETSDRVRAHLIRSVLEDAGIPAHVSGDALQGALGEIPVNMLAMRVQVPYEHAELAREIALETEGHSRHVRSLEP